MKKYVKSSINSMPSIDYVVNGANFPGDEKQAEYVETRIKDVDSMARYVFDQIAYKLKNKYMDHFSMNVTAQEDPSDGSCAVTVQTNVSDLKSQISQAIDEYIESQMKWVARTVAHEMPDVKVESDLGDTDPDVFEFYFTQK